ncbi:PepSY domain-containing protein [Thalassotalea sp. M1531]|uniref:PepSY domain-containing protein n=2 Tax=Thalassotalea algicola TaxID=2716224 RepID=A0A7Y0Q6C9_9GAMM|nr:PepSY domain-containing protein [Thalassotalea algicola]
MALIGLQFVIWSITGVYMVVMDIDYIHGDSLIENHQITIDATKVNYTLPALINAYPDAIEIELGNLLEQAVYRFKRKNSGNRVMVSAIDGSLLSPLTQDTAQEIAEFYYAGGGTISAINLIAQTPPFELSARHLPSWQIIFDDNESSVLYVSALTGNIVTKRHQYWRMFDWMFRFHVMDYQDSEIDNQLLFWIALFGLIAAFSGAALAYFRVYKPYQHKRKVSANNRVSI